MLGFFNFLWGYGLTHCLEPMHFLLVSEIFSLRVEKKELVLFVHCGFHLWLIKLGLLGFTGEFGLIYTGGGVQGCEIIGGG